jgi:hypothetical protein
MTVARSVADVRAEHVSFEVECIDRMYLNVYQPRLQHAAGVAWFLCGHRGAGRTEGGVRGAGAAEERGVPGHRMDTRALVLRSGAAGLVLPTAAETGVADHRVFDGYVRVAANSTNRDEPAACGDDYYLMTRR